MEQITLNREIIMVLSMIGLAVFLFIVEWIRVDMVAILMTVLLPILNLVTPKEAFSGFSSNAVISIIAVIIIGAGLDKTGLINRLVQPVVKLAGNSPSRIVLAMGATVAFISSFMQNIGAAALFLPAVKRVSKSMHLPLSQMLMPIGFCAILGGTVTLVGSSPLILLNDLMIPFNLKPFGLFDVTPIGVALVTGGIASFVLLGRFILPKGQDLSHDPVQQDGAKWTYEDLGETFELYAPPDFNAFRDPLMIKHLRDGHQINVVGFAGRDRLKMTTLPPDFEIQGDSHLAIFGRKEKVLRMAQEHGFEVKEDLTLFKENISPENFGVIEAVVAPRSELIGKTLREVHFWEQYQVNPLALYRADEIFYSGLSSIRLRSGDSIVLGGTWERFKILAEKHNFISPVRSGRS